MKIFISAGEASGDALGASLMRALKAKRDDLQFFGMGGPQMEAEGFDKSRDAGEVAVVGLVEVIKHLPRLFRLKAELAATAIAAKPQVAVLIDVPDFNVRLARVLRRAEIPVVFYVGPSVWAWRRGRVKSFAKVIDRLLVLFPFETPIWTEAGVDALCVGHPLIDQVAPAEDGESRTVALLPGSRRSEIERLLGVMLGAAARLKEEGLADDFVLPAAPTLDPDMLRARIEESGVPVRIVQGEANVRRAAVASSRLALVASGTATLETALLGRPQVIVYRFNRLTFWIGRLMTKLQHIGLPNIIAGREVAPELLQDDLTVDNLVEKARALLEGPERAAALSATEEVRRRLGDHGAADRAAAAVLELLPRRR